MKALERKREGGLSGLSRESRESREARGSRRATRDSSRGARSLLRATGRIRIRCARGEDSYGPAGLRGYADLGREASFACNRTNPLRGRAAYGPAGWRRDAASPRGLPDSSRIRAGGETCRRHVPTGGIRGLRIDIGLTGYCNEASRWIWLCRDAFISGNGGGDLVERGDFANFGGAFGARVKSEE